MTIDVHSIRSDTPGCQHVLHFNSAGASLPSTPVLETVTSYLQREATTGGYAAAAEASGALEGVYDSVAALIGATRDEIALQESATRAWDMAFYSLPLQVGDRVLTCVADYSSNAVAMLHLQKRLGIVIDVVPNDPSGQIDLEALAVLARQDDARVIALTHVPSQGGLVNPARAVGEIAADAGLYYLLDACQSVGQIPVDVRQIGCHFLSATGRKFLRGPRGTGFLYVNRDVLQKLDPVMLEMRGAEWVAPDRYVLRDDARRFENWETSFAGRLGLGKAVDYAMDVGLDEIERRNRMLAEMLREKVRELPGYHIHDQGETLCAITTFSGPRPADEYRALLREEKINVSVTRATTAQYDLGARGIDSLVRASVHYFNTEEEIDLLVSVLRDS